METVADTHHQGSLSVMIATLNPWKTPNTATAFCKRGITKQAKGDMDGAIADYDKAIELDPKAPRVYDYRGFAKRTKGDLDGAIADYNKAIELDPQDANGYHNRAFAKQAKGDVDGAIVDYDRAIKLNPSEAHAYNNRGSARLTKGDVDGALVDFDKAIELNPKDASAHQNRASIRRTKGDVDGALADYDKALEFNPKDTNVYYDRGTACYDKHDWSDALSDFRKASPEKPEVEKLETVQDYSRIRIWLVRAKLGERDAATSELSEYLRNRTIGKPGDWASTIARFLTGDLSESDCLKAANSGDEKQTRYQKCEAYFYAGSLRLINDDKSIAVDHFTKCLETGGKNSYEYQSATAELEALKQ
jgi:tetratricopeptide (TPR) repeat protein